MKRESHAWLTTRVALFRCANKKALVTPERVWTTTRRDLRQLSRYLQPATDPDDGYYIVLWPKGLRNAQPKARVVGIQVQASGRHVTPLMTSLCPIHEYHHAHKATSNFKLTRSEQAYIMISELSGGKVGCALLRRSFVPASNRECGGSGRNSQLVSGGDPVSLQTGQDLSICFYPCLGPWLNGTWFGRMLVLERACRKQEAGEAESLLICILVQTCNHRAAHFHVCLPPRAHTILKAGRLNNQPAMKKLFSMTIDDGVFF